MVSKIKYIGEKFLTLIRQRVVGESRVSQLRASAGPSKSASGRAENCNHFQVPPTSAKLQVLDPTCASRLRFCFTTRPFSALSRSPPIAACW